MKIMPKLVTGIVLLSSFFALCILFFVLLTFNIEEYISGDNVIKIFFHKILACTANVLKWKVTQEVQ